MPLLKYSGKPVQVDADGCLVSFEEWDETVARALAAGEGIAELGREAVEMLKFIRNHYRRYDFFPIPKSICRFVGEQKDCLAERFTSPLTAWKLAGLPHPEEPVISLLEAGQSPG